MVRRLRQGRATPALPWHSTGDPGKNEVCPAQLPQNNITLKSQRALHGKKTNDIAVAHGATPATRACDTCLALALDGSPRQK